LGYRKKIPIVLVVTKRLRNGDTREGEEKSGDIKIVM